MTGGGAPKQASLRRLREFDVRPNRELGQNFLIDDNILAVIERAAELAPGDVVLEVGGGLGVLSEHLAPRVAHLHVVEVDRTLEPPLAEALAPFDNATLHVADAVTLDYRSLAPTPTKVVANLPYGVAATVVLKSIEELPDAELWVAMVQREVGERLAAAPGSKVYGATSAIAQIACEVKVLRRVPATVFHPAPNVVSALVQLRRTAAAPESRAIDLIHAAFAHRRKALRGALRTVAGSAEAAERALLAAGIDPLARGESLGIHDFVRLTEELRR